MLKSYSLDEWQVRSWKITVNLMAFLFNTISNDHDMAVSKEVFDTCIDRFTDKQHFDAP